MITSTFDDALFVFVNFSKHYLICVHTSCVYLVYTLIHAFSQHVNDSENFSKTHMKLGALMRASLCFAIYFNMVFPTKGTIAIALVIDYLW